ncbi:MAG TPA: polysaccharide deacetylase family protein [Ktedonobacteraceae bacterium]|jgi:peptidoglycan/xylan/chitin deacetylase (PgdA/CDA1 family)|nr:polysaccharide deacetylase family protein [Ktedonobacteraceae bacterium]
MSSIQDRVVRHGDVSRAEVALTFDDGPNPPHTLQILEVLRFYKAQATFFCIGEQVQKFPEVVEQIQREGHFVANHTWSHPALPDLTEEGVSLELTRCTDIIEQVTGARPTLFRTPYNRQNDRVLTQVEEHQMVSIFGNDAARDWQMPGADVIYQRVTANFHNGDILVMHDGGGDRSGTAEVLPRIIEWVRAQKMEVVTLRQLVPSLI